MARVKASKDAPAQAQAAGPDPVVEGGDDGAPPPPPLVDQAPFAPAAVREPRPEEAQVPPAVRYRVAETARVMVNGCCVTLKAGKVLDSHNYDIERLRAQAVRLQPVRA